jgi:hypothetical protein
MPIEEVAVELDWDPAKLSGTWEPDAAERDASWQLLKHFCQSPPQIIGRT